MSALYGPVHRALQERFDTRRLADNVEKRVVLPNIPPEHKAFIESRDMFFLSTVDHQGRPTVSYKGGDPGFVRVLNDKTVAFPCYDGNGMFYSMGNLIGNSQVGMLFMDFEKPHRLRLQGVANVVDDDPLLQDYVEAQLVVRVSVTQVFAIVHATYIAIRKLNRRNMCRVRHARRRSRLGSALTMFKLHYRLKTAPALSKKAV
jgi:uncharacterized protein